MELNEEQIQKKVKSKRQHNIWSFTIFALLVAVCIFVHYFRLHPKHAQNQQTEKQTVIMPDTSSTVPAHAASPQK